MDPLPRPPAGLTAITTSVLLIIAARPAATVFVPTYLGASPAGTAEEPLCCCCSGPKQGARLLQSHVTVSTCVLHKRSHRWADESLYSLLEATLLPFPAPWAAPARVSRQLTISSAADVRLRPYSHVSWPSGGMARTGGVAAIAEAPRHLVNGTLPVNGGESTFSAANCVPASSLPGPTTPYALIACRAYQTHGE